MRAPQYRRVTERKMPVGPNPAIAKGLRVAPWANIFALVDGLGVISPYRTEAEAKAALEVELARRKSIERVAVGKDADKTPNSDGGGGAE
jgi:hypothetical protein